MVAGTEEQTMIDPSNSASLLVNVGWQGHMYPAIERGDGGHYIEPMDVPLMFMVYSSVDSDQGAVSAWHCKLMSFEIWRAVL